MNGSSFGNADWWDEPSGQPVALAPAPGNDHDDYAFFWNKAEANGQLAFALGWVRVDMRLNGGHGAVAARGLLPTLTRNPRLTIVRHANNRDFWVLTRDLDTRGFQAFRLTAAGVDPVAVVSLAGQAQYPNVGELKAAPNGAHLACPALRRTGNTGEALLCVYDFDNATGAVRNELVVRRVPVTGVTAYPDGRPVGGTVGMPTCSFSPDSRLLYAAESNPNASATFRRFNELWQYDLSQPTPAAIAASRYWVSNVPTPTRDPLDVLECLGLQLAPDGTLWAGQLYQRYLVRNSAGQWPLMAAAIVRHPNVAGAGCGFEPEGYAYQPGQVPGALPNLITNMLYAPAALNYEVGCPDDSVRLWASSAGDPAGLRWDFGEPASGAANTASGRQVAHRYARGGPYAVRLTLADGRVLTQTVAVPAGGVDFTDANIFTPNADGYNDAFVPVRTPLPGGQLRVYSRWGQPVYHTADPALRWDGAGAAAGEYFYQLEYPDCHGTPQQRRGVLTLVR